MSWTPAVQAMGWRAPLPPTCREQAEQSEFIVFVRAENARKDANGDRTDLAILKVIKDHPALRGLKSIPAPILIAITDPMHPPTLVVFGNVSQNKIELTSGYLGDTLLCDYVSGLLTTGKRGRLALLRYCFDHLENEDKYIASDAYQELHSSNEADVRTLTRGLPAEPLRRCLRNEKTPATRIPFYSLLLAYCGHPRDAALLIGLLDKRVKEEASDLADLFTACILLSAPDGWTSTTDVIDNAEARFGLRLAAFKAVCYCFERRPDGVTEVQMLAAFDAALQQPDFADLAIDFLKEKQCWKLTDRILALAIKPGFEGRFMQRRILCYAVFCPEASAIKFVAAVRKVDPSWVEFYEKMFRETEGKRRG